MNRKELFYKIGSLISVLLLSFVLSIIIYNNFENLLLEKLATVVGVTTNNSKELEIKVMKELKSEYSRYTSIGRESLERYGYNKSRFIFLKDKKKVIYISLIFSSLITLLYYMNMKILDRNKKRSIENLKSYLEGINKGDYSLSLTGEDDFSILSDEIYKTVVTLRELEEKAILDKINLKDNMADISHQLKTPITSIHIMSELMGNSNSKSEGKEYIDRLNKQIARLETLTNSLLTMSKLDADTIELKKDILNIKNTIDLAIEPVMVLIEEKNIKLRIIGDGVTIKGDNHWLSEAFLNIIKNCIEHLEENGEIEIFMESNPIFIEVRIEDNGNGFVKEDLPYIFKRFYKGKNSNKDSIGIGLSMARTIIEKHGGEITVENRLEGGARFKIKFY